eukprot:COSAG06_NODE_6430_length_2935_cov_15.773977_2_plen_192_part_00
MRTPSVTREACEFAAIFLSPSALQACLRQWLSEILQPAGEACARSVISPLLRVALPQTKARPRRPQRTPGVAAARSHPQPSAWPLQLPGGKSHLDREQRAKSPKTDSPEREAVPTTPPPSPRGSKRGSDSPEQRSSRRKSASPDNHAMTLARMRVASLLLGRCPQTRALLAFSRRDVSADLTWRARRRIAE